MKAMSAISIAVAVAGFSLAGAAWGGDAGNSGHAAALSAKVDQDINQAVSGDAGTSSADLDSRIQELESTRAAIDEKRPPKVSLSVSGWVSQEVQYNIKQ